MTLTVISLATSELGNRSYLVHDDTAAIVIDPPRDIDRIHTLLDTHGLRCAAVAETHIHNDYLTGGAELGRQCDCPYLVNAADPVRFDRHGVSDGEQLSIAGLRLTALATPGHTDTHLAYLVESENGRAPAALFSGGSLLYGSVGRTDLVSPQRTEDLTRAQYHSVHRLAGLPAATRLFPTHGFGSFCSSNAIAHGEAATIGEECSRNDAFTAADEAGFVAALMSRLGPYPAYYRHMAPRNLAGPGPAALDLPSLLDHTGVVAAAAGPGWVVDLRGRRTHAQAHLPGTIGVELGPGFATYLGWILPWGIQLTLIAATAEQLLQARRQLTRIGVDDIAGGALVDDNFPSPAASYPVADFADLARVLGRGTTVLVLDTRQRSEHDIELVPGALNIPLHELPDRIADIPAGRIWVHCASGYRASVAASLLARAGRTVILIDDTFSSATRLGLTTAEAPTAAASTAHR